MEFGTVLGICYGVGVGMWGWAVRQFTLQFVDAEDAHNLDRHDRIVLNSWSFTMGFLWPITIPLAAYGLFCYWLFTRHPERYDGSAVTEPAP